MTEAAAAAAWLAELLGLLAEGVADDEDAERELDRVLAAGLRLDDPALLGLDPTQLGAAMAALGAARLATKRELDSLQRRRIDMNRTVKAITAYVHALS